MMNKYIATCGLTLLLSHLSLSAAEVNFTPTYVINSATNAQTMTLGGVDIVLDGNDFPMPHILKLGFNAENNEFFVIDTVPQGVDGSLLEAQLQNTFWKGEYSTNTNFYYTSLHIISVENGFVGAQVIHDTGSPEQDNFLRAQLAGTIFSEYLIPNPNANNIDEVPEIWITQTAYLERVAEIEAANAELLAGEDGIGVNRGALELQTPPPILNIRQQLRLKRVLGIEFRHASARWGSTNEYHLTLENGFLNGVAGTPSDSYSNNSGMTGNGAIKLLPAHIYDAEREPFPPLVLE